MIWNLKTKKEQRKKESKKENDQPKEKWWIPNSYYGYIEASSTKSIWWNMASRAKHDAGQSLIKSLC